MAATENGIVPKGSVASMVNRLSRHSIPQAPNVITVRPLHMKPPLAEPPLFVVTFAYTATQPDEMDLAQGEVIEFLEEIEDGWARGRRKRDMMEGLYPTNFVSEIKGGAALAANSTAAVAKANLFGTSDCAKKFPVANVSATSPTSSPSTTFSTPPPAANTAPPQTAAKRMSSGGGGHADMNSNTAAAMEEKILRTPSQNSTPKKEEEMARVLFTYKADHEDELSLTKIGQMVRILDKNPGDTGWFLGELNGKKGLFPDNFVELVKVPVSASTSPSQKPPAKPPGGGTVPSTVPLIPPTVPAKPPKNVLSNSNSNLAAASSSAPSTSMKSSGSTSSTAASVTSSPNVTSNSVPAPTPAAVAPPVGGRAPVTAGGISELKSKLMSAGLFSRGAPTPGDMPALLSKGNNHNVEPAGPVLDEDDSFDANGIAPQLVHLNKGRPKQPTKRPMSMVAFKRNSQEDLLDEAAMSRSSVFASSVKTDSSPQPRETTFPAQMSPPHVTAPPQPTAPVVEQHVTATPAVSKIQYDEKPKESILHKNEDVKFEAKSAIVPPSKALSTSMHSLLSTSQQSLSTTGTSASPSTTFNSVIVKPSYGNNAHSAQSSSTLTSSSSTSFAAAAAASGDNNRSQWVSRAEFDALQKRCNELEARLAALEKRV